MLFQTKSKKLNAITLTIKLLADFHAVRPDNEQFQRTYRNLFALQQLYKENENV